MWAMLPLTAMLHVAAANVFFGSYQNHHTNQVPSAIFYTAYQMVPQPVPEDQKTKDLPCSSAGFFTHPTICDRFYRCVDFTGVGSSFSTYEFICPAGTVFVTEGKNTCIPGDCPGGSSLPAPVAPSAGVEAAQQGVSSQGGQSSQSGVSSQGTQSGQPAVTYPPEVLPAPGSAGSQQPVSTGSSSSVGQTGATSVVVNQPSTGSQSTTLYPTGSQQGQSGSMSNQGDMPQPDPTIVATQPGVGAAAQPGAGAATQPGAGAATQPGAGAATQPGAGAAAQPGTGAAAQPGAGVAAQPGAGAAAQPGAGSATQPGAGAAAQPGAGAATQPGVGAATQPGVGAVVQPGAGAAVQPAVTYPPDVLPVPGAQAPVQPAVQPVPVPVVLPTPAAPQPSLPGVGGFVQPGGAYPQPGGAVGGSAVVGGQTGVSTGGAYPQPGGAVGGSAAVGGQSGASTGGAVDASSSQCAKDYVQDAQYCNVYHSCPDDNKRYVCTQGSAFDQTRQICDLYTKETLCVGKQFKDEKSFRASNAVILSGFYPVVKSPSFTYSAPQRSSVFYQNPSVFYNSRPIVYTLG